MTLSRDNLIISPARKWASLETIRDVSVLAVLPGLFRVSFSGASLEFQNRAAFFQGLTNTSGNLSEQLGTLAILALGVLLFIKSGWRVARVLQIAIPFLPFLTFALLSTTWSDYPDLTLRRSTRLAIEMTGTILIAISYANNYRRLLNITFLFCIIIAIVDF